VISSRHDACVVGEQAPEAHFVDVDLGPAGLDLRPPEVSSAAPELDVAQEASVSIDPILGRVGNQAEPLARLHATFHRGRGLRLPAIIDRRIRSMGLRCVDPDQTDRSEAVIREPDFERVAVDHLLKDDTRADRFRRRW
jgi:hypothetical protein